MDYFYATTEVLIIGFSLLPKSSRIFKPTKPLTVTGSSSPTGKVLASQVDNTGYGDRII